MTYPSNANYVVSPVSIATGLEMVGKAAAGATAEEFRALRYSGDSASDLGALLQAAQRPGLRIHNALFLDRMVAAGPDFRRVLEGDFHASLVSTDFTGHGANVVRDWLKSKSSMDAAEFGPGTTFPDTALVTASVVQLSAKWATSFRPRHAGNFDAPDGATEVEMMQADALAGVADSEHGTVARIPFQNGYAMVLILPKTSLAALEAQISDEVLHRWLGDAHDLRQVDLELPVFKVSSSASSSVDTLRALGFRSAIDPALADFANLQVKGGRHRVFLKSLVTSASIRVDEYGGEGAAATIARIAVGGDTGPPVKFHANRPFLFSIIDERTGLVLFVGRVVRPRG